MAFSVKSQFAVTMTMLDMEYVLQRKSMTARTRGAFRKSI